MRTLFVICLLFFSSLSVAAELPIKPGAYQLNLYLPLLENKRVALLANQSSLIGKEHVIDVLLQHHIHVVKIFAVEHGFRGAKDDKFSNTVDEKTGIPIVSLYGKKLKPDAADLENVDIIIFDIQDVGVRFYTYISSLQKLMEAAAEQHKPIIVLDRPNPNGFYVDGPVLDKKYKSFIGMQAIPVIYGMTIGEYAKMLIGENWLELTANTTAQDLKLTVIPCVNYTHKSLYTLPIKPSPNLPNMQSVYWYPSIALFERTPLSVGRGTKHPFQEFGHPSLKTTFTFIPRAKNTVSVPPYVDQVCHGWSVVSDRKTALKNIDHKLQIKYLLLAYQLFPNKEKFFSHFEEIAGTELFKQQIIDGVDEATIRQSWEADKQAFLKIRQHYLLYPDF